MTPSSIARLSDHDLLEHLHQATQHERSATAQLIAFLAEVDSRRLHLPQGYSTIFTYCVCVLHLSEHAAFRRIEAARLSRRFSIVLELIDSGAITLAALHLLGPHLTDANHRELLEQARHRSKRDIEHMVATLHPRPDVPPTVCALAVPSNSKALSPEHYEIQCTISKEAHDHLCELRDLLRHSVPDGDIGEIFERAIATLREEVLRIRTGAAKHPRETIPADGTSRYIQRSVRRAVWARDGGRCAFVGTQGRCNEQGFLQFHHVVPWAVGGRTIVENIELRCRAHNSYEADVAFGTFHACDETGLVPAASS